MRSGNLSRTLNQSIFRLTCQVRAHNLRFGHGSSQKDEKDAYGYIYVHMDTHGYIKWIHMGAQEPGCGTKLAAGPWAPGQGQGQGPWTGPGPKGPWTGPGPMGPWPTPPHPRAPPPVLCHSLALGPPYVSILCIHVCPYVHRCIHMYPYPLNVLCPCPLLPMLFRSHNASWDMWGINI